jgi:hypothetical protein
MTSSKQAGPASQTIAIPGSVIAACNRHNICRKTAFGGSSVLTFSRKDIREYEASQNPDELGSSIVGCQGKKGKVGQIQVLWPAHLPEGDMVTPGVHMKTLTERIVTHLDEFGGTSAHELNVQVRETKPLDSNGEYVQSAYLSFKLEAEKVVGTVIYVSNRMEGTGKRQSNRVVGVYTFSAARATAPHVASNGTVSKGTSTHSAPTLVGATG